MKKISLPIILLVAALVFYMIAGVFFYKGHDKMTNYYNSESFYSLNRNAYVGGDAYNYIINGNYATGFFTLATGFMITGTLLGSTGLLLSRYPAGPVAADLGRREASLNESTNPDGQN